MMKLTEMRIVQSQILIISFNSQSSKKTSLTWMQPIKKGKNPRKIPNIKLKTQRRLTKGYQTRVDLREVMNHLKLDQMNKLKIGTKSLKLSDHNQAKGGGALSEQLLTNILLIRKLEIWKQLKLLKLSIAAWKSTIILMNKHTWNSLLSREKKV